MSVCDVAHFSLPPTIIKKMFLITIRVQTPRVCVCVCVTLYNCTSGARRYFDTIPPFLFK